MKIALELRSGSPVLSIDGNDVPRRRGLGPSLGFSRNVDLDDTMLPIVALLMQERLDGNYPRSGKDEEVGWVDAERLASLLVKHRTPGAVRDFLATRLAPYPWRSIKGDAETQHALHELPQHYLVQYFPRRRILSVPEGSMPGRENDEPGRYYGRTLGPYRISSGRSDLTLDRRAFILATFGTGARVLLGEPPARSYVEHLIEDLGPELTRKGELSLAYALYDAYIGLSRTQRGAKNEHDDRVQRIKLRIGFADAAIELGRTRMGLKRIIEATKIIGDEKVTAELLDAARTQSLLYGQGGNGYRARSTMYAFKDHIKMHVRRAPWYLATLAQALTKLGAFKHANEYYERARSFILHGSGLDDDDRALLAVIGFRQAENASKAYAVEKSAPHGTADWVTIADAARVLVNTYEGFLPPIWNVLKFRVLSGASIPFGQYDEALSLARAGLQPARETGMTHEQEELEEHIRALEEMREQEHRARTKLEQNVARTQESEDVEPGDEPGSHDS